MSAPSRTITRLASDNAGLNYRDLVAEGTRLVQALSGKIWTNYNYSDPGVTILEQLCYALTELSYRADFPVQDLLGAPDTGHITLARQGLYAARAIMPVNPVTPMDLRRLLIDRVPELANVWCTPLAAAAGRGVHGLYRIDLLLPADDCDCDAPAPDRAALVARVLDCYAAHRALCEDVHVCQVLMPIALRISAEVQLDDNSDPDQVLADLLFAAGMCLTPEPKRTSLAQQRAAGLSTADIFQGPLMLRGFIADEQLMPLPRDLALEALLVALVEVPGVLSVDFLTAQAGDDPQRYRVGELVPVPEGCILQLELAWRTVCEHIRLYYCGVRCTPNLARVRRLLDRAWHVQRRTYPLWAQYRAAYGPPQGRAMDLAVYSSVQDQFPSVYGIGAYGLPSEASPTRRAQARQLKGYLMAFDQLMANYFSQLAFVRDLFSVGAGGDRTYVWQSLRTIVPDAEALLLPGYAARMDQLLADMDPVVARQSEVIDLLLSLYASPLTATAPAANDVLARDAQADALLKAKQVLLARIVPATRDRGRGADYRRGGLRRERAGMEIRCRIELDLLDADTGGHARERLYIVDWILLRYATEREPDGVLAQDVSFRVSAVMPSRHEGDEAPGEGWRSQARAILRANTPAHIVVDDVFLGHQRMKRFMRLHDLWVHALRHGPHERRVRTSGRLARFLRPSR